MPPRKRTESKHTPPTSPTATTSHTSADHHHLRHAGPSVSTRARASTTSSKLPAQQETAPETSEKKPLNDEASSPDTGGPLSKFMFLLFLCVLLVFAWYIYTMAALLEKLKDEAGWWGIITGDPSAEAWKGYGSERPDGARRGDLEGSLNALADALGISAVQVAAAVKPLVPQASLTNIASKAESGSSEAVRILVENATPRDN